MNKDKFIKQQMKKDEYIPKEINDIFQRFEKSVKLEKKISNMHIRVIKTLSLVAGFMLVFTIGAGTGKYLLFKNTDNQKVEVISNGNVSTKNSLKTYGGSYVSKNIDFKYGPYILTITEDNNLLIEFENAEKVKKEVGAIELYTTDTMVKNEKYGFYAEWNKQNSKQLKVSVYKYTKETEIICEELLYYFDDNGNMLNFSKDVKEQKEEQKEVEVKVKTVETKKAIVETKVEEPDNSLIYTNNEMYGEFYIGITVDNRIVAYKIEKDKRVVYISLDSQIPKEKVLNVEYIKENGPGFYADWNNFNQHQLRIRIDKYIDDDSIRDGYDWYIYDNNGNLIQHKEYLEEIEYNNSIKYGEFKSTVNKNNELIIYKEENDNLTIKKVVCVKIPLECSLENNKDACFYIKWDDDTKTLNVRTDKYLDNDTIRDGYVYYVYDKDGKEISKKEIVESFAYEDSKQYGDFKIGITKDNKIVVYKTEAIGKYVYKTLESYISLDNLTDIEYIKKYGPGYYADWNNQNKELLRIRVDKYLDTDMIRDGYKWYQYNKKCELISVDEIEENLNEKSQIKYEDFNIGINKNSELIIYKNEKLHDEDFEKTVSYVTICKMSGNSRYYADWNNAESSQLRVRVDNFLEGTEKRYSYKWFIYDEQGNLVEEVKEVLE